MRKNFRIMVWATSVSALVPSIAPAAVTPVFAASHKQMFVVPAQPLKDALNAVSEQSGLRILYPYDQIAGLRSRAIRGHYTPAQALERLTAGTPLKLAMASNGMIALTASSPRGAAQRRPGIVQIAQASAPSASSNIALLAMAQAPAQVAEAEPPSEIIVTGTRQLTRTVAESLAPIDVLSAADLQTSGKQSVRDLLGTLVPSISVSNGGAGASFAVKTLSLRGLAGDQVLVLVNGKRRHNTATLFINGTTQNGQSPPDLDLIPASSIERIEVLRDGASAQYGSDAIAGVINLILKDDPMGGSLSMLMGQTWHGDGETGQIQGDIGFALGEEGHIHFAVDGRLQGRTDRGQPNLAPTIYTFPGRPRDPRDDTVSRAGLNHPGQPHVENINGSYDMELPLGDAASLYSFGTASKRKSNSWLTYRNPNATNNIVEIYPNGYVPRLHIYDLDYQGIVGVRGDGPAEIHYDLSTSYSRNRVKYSETTALNASLGPASPTDFYIGKVISTEWTSNLDLQRKFDLGMAEELFVAAGAEYRENSYEIGAGELASYVDGGYRSPVGQPYAGVVRVTGSQGVTGFSPDAAGKFKRNAWSAYLNIEQKIIEGFEVSLAGRHEDYSDFGTTDTGKVSFRVEPVKGIALRGTASTGFRAPTLQQQHYASSSTIGIPVNGVVTLLPVQALPVDSAAAIALGAAPLKAEKSTSFSTGLVLTPARSLNLTIDAYQIKIDDRILLSGTLSGPAVNAALAAAGITSAAAGFYFSNAADTRTRGLDVVGTYRTSLGDIGAATFSLSANFNKTKFTHIDLPPPALANATPALVLIDRARRGDFEKGTPRSKFIAAVNWNHGPLGVNARATRYGKVTQMVATPLPTGVYVDEVIDPKVIVDLDVSYAVNDKIKLTVGSNNLFNTYPPVLQPSNQGTTGFAYYNTYSPYGISGGFYYAKLGLTF